MTKAESEVELAKIALAMKKSANFCTNLKTVGMYTTFAFLVYSCGRGMTDIINGNPESLQWLYRILHETKLATIVHSCVTVLFGGTAVLQFSRNRRLTKKSGDMRHKIEQNDKSNERSGLDPDGTAKEDREV